MPEQAKFSSQDAQALVNHAQSAPLQHLGHAQQIGELLARFSAWFNALEAEKEKLHAEISELKNKIGISP